MSSCFSRCLRVPIAMRRFYEQTLWIPQKFLLTNLDLHHGLLAARKEIPNKFQAQRACTRRPPTRCDFACRTRNFATSNCLVVRPEEKVIGRVGHELSLTRGADAGRDSSAVGVQTLNEAGVGQEVTARGPFLVPHRLQQ